MGATKREFYTEDQIQMANMFKALGHPARIAILERLAKDENLNCKNLHTLIPLAKSTISYHLKELFENGLLGYAVHGSSSYYQPQITTLKLITDYISNICEAVKKKCKLIPLGYSKPRLIHKIGFFLRL